MMKIDSFTGHNRYLSNFWVFGTNGVFLDGVEYPSVEHAYQARDVELAYLMAKMFHKEQVRMAEVDEAGVPRRYFEHPRRAAVSLVEAGITDPTTIIAMLLHDVVEDAEEVQLATTLVERVFGADVARIVQAVTKLPKEGYMSRLYDSLSPTQGRSLLVKAADRLDNLRTLPANDPEFCERQKRETREQLFPLFADAHNRMPDGLRRGFLNIVGAIHNLVYGVNG